MQFTLSQAEQAQVLSFAEKLLYVAVAAVVDYVANHFSLLPFSPLVIGVLSPVVMAAKFFFDGKVS